MVRIFRSFQKSDKSRIKPTGLGEGFPLGWLLVGYNLENKLK